MIEYYVTIKIEGKQTTAATLTKEQLLEDFDKYLAISDGMTIEKMSIPSDLYDQQAVS